MENGLVSEAKKVADNKDFDPEEVDELLRFLAGPGNGPPLVSVKQTGPAVIQSIRSNFAH